ncbi:MAG: HlyD family efflux transporter periplasmic adaptor subunit [Leptolyngbya sp. Prado105]|jgi:multidrug resistance efflux pump|nr:HlyD family efflux transporter periplasmic adaptor subunit [Leptolyngbya sp. Prado105]
MKYLSGLLNRVLLCGTGAGLLGWGVAQTAPHVTGVVATKAVINGSIVTIHSPIAGQVQRIAPLESGSSVLPQQSFLKVVDAQGSTDWIRAAQLAVVTEKTKIAGLSQQLQTIAEDPSSLMMPANPVPMAAIQLATQAVTQAETELEIAITQANQAQAKSDRMRSLGQEGAISSILLGEVQTQAQVLNQQVEIARTKLQSARLNLAEQQRLQAESLQPKFDRQAIQSRQQRIEAIQQQQAELQASVTQREQAIAQAQNTQNYNAVSPVQGVVWEVLVQNGMQVTPGQALIKVLDCRQRWVDAYVNVDDLDRIEIGNAARIEFNKGQTLQGTVKTIRPRAAEGQTLGQDAAAPPPNIDTQQFAQLRIEIDSATTLANEPDQSARFCQVGKLVQVKIEPSQSKHPIFHVLAIAQFWK